MSKLSISSTKISIALCTYNGAKFLSEQLESFRAQTRLPDELVVRDDCSRDETVKIIEDFVKTAPFPVLFQINERNLGSTKNFEGAIADCTGDLIFLSDQDDIWLPEKIAAMEKEFENNADLGLVFTDAELIDENSNSLGFNLLSFTTTEDERANIKADNSFETLLRRNIITGATMAFRSNLKILFTPIPQEIKKLIHDGWIALISSLYSKIDFIDNSLVLYRQHGNQQIGIDWETKRTDKISSKFSRKYEERIDYFDESINFFYQEIERIKKTISLLKVYVKSEESINTSFNTFDKLADKFIAEKLNAIAHLEVRKHLPNNRLERIYPILNECSTKRYHLFSRGFYGIGRDLLEKWK